MELLTHFNTTAVVVILVALTCVRAALSLAERQHGAQDMHLQSAGEVLESLIIAMVLVFLVIRPFLLQAFYIPSGSMAPTLAENDRILVNKLSYRLGGPHRHDVVVFRAPPEALIGDPDGQDKDFVKRVIGLPGDTVEVHDGVTYINGARDNEPFTGQSADGELPPMLVPDGKLFVLGDNRDHSNDSRRWGTLDMDRIIGRAVFIFWPPTRAGVIH